MNTPEENLTLPVSLPDFWIICGLIPEQKKIILLGAAPKASYTEALAIGRSRAVGEFAQVSSIDAFNLARPTAQIRANVRDWFLSNNLTLDETDDAEKVLFLQIAALFAKVAERNLDDTSSEAKSD